MSKELLVFAFLAKKDYDSLWRMFCLSAQALLFSRLYYLLLYFYFVYHF